MQLTQSQSPLTVGAQATLACIWEATAAKPGNVHRGTDFDDVTYAEFLAAAVAIGPILERAAGQSFGTTLLEAVRVTKSLVATNTNLGTLLLMVPLAAVAEANVAKLFRHATQSVADTSVADTAALYEAIQLASAGGLGKVDEADVLRPPPAISVVQVMQLAADRDLIARQLVHGFMEVAYAASQIEQQVAEGRSLHEAIVATSLKLQTKWPDSLIQRKLGETVAREASARAGKAISAGPLGSPDYHSALADFDFWLRSDGHRRNPGTTADLIAGALFALLRQKRILLPVRFYG